MRNTVLAYEIFAALLIAGLMGAQTSIAQTVGGYPDWSVKKVVPCAVGIPIGEWRCREHRNYRKILPGVLY
jgi:hypothetical protein